MDVTQTFMSFVYSTDVLNEYVQNIIDRTKYYDDRLLNRYVLSSLQVLLTKFVILSLKEEIIDKPKNDTYKNKLAFKEVDELASVVAERNEDGTYSIQSVVFKDAEEVVAKIRNKIAHEDYIISKDGLYLIINFDGQQIPIPIYNLEVFALMLSNLNKEYKKTSNYKQVFALKRDSSIKNVFSYYKPDMIDDILKDYEMFEIKLESSDGNIPCEAYKAFDKYQERINGRLYYYRDDKPTVRYDKVKHEILSEAKSYNDLSEKRGLNTRLNVNIFKLDEEMIEKVKRLVDYSIDTDGMRVIQVMSNIDRLLCNIYNKEDSVYTTFHQGSVLIYILDAIERFGTTQIMDIFNIYNNRKNPFDSLRLDQDTLGVIQVLRIFALSYLLENTNVDCSELALDKLEPEVLVEEDVELNELNKNKDALINNSEKLTTTLEEKQNQLNNMESSNVSMEKIKLVRGLINNLRERLSIDKQKYDEIVTRIDNKTIDKEKRTKHYRNKLILESLRNSLSHGNIQIDLDGDIRKAIMTFTDYNDKGELVFKLSISISELDQILTESIDPEILGKVRIK